MRGPEILAWLLFLKPLIKKARVKKAIEAVPEIQEFRRRFKEAFQARQGLGLTVEEVQGIGSALGME